MKNVFVPSNYEKVYETNNESVYNISFNDKFIKIICDIYNINLGLVVQKEFTNYICMYHYNDYVSKVLPFSRFFIRAIVLKNYSTNQFITLRRDFFNNYDSFQMNIDECVESLKEKIVDALMRGFNTLSERINGEGDFGTIPCGSSENEIMMKMELRGF